MPRGSKAGYRQYSEKTERHSDCTATRRVRSKVNKINKKDKNKVLHKYATYVLATSMQPSVDQQKEVLHKCYATW